MPTSLNLPGPKLPEAKRAIANAVSAAISAAIKAVNAHYTDGVNGYDVEIAEFGKCFETEDFEEGTSAFLEKRKPNFEKKYIP